MVLMLVNKQGMVNNEKDNEAFLIIEKGAIYGAFDVAQKASHT